MEEKELLQRIGLTGSESKVYLALLKIGDFSSKGKILKEARIASSKIYDILNKLIDKGLVSTIIKNNVKYFVAAHPSRLKDYLESKKKKIAEEEQAVKEILPKLGEEYKSIINKTTAEVFFGWRGMETAYFTIINTMKKGQIAYVLGASEGEDREKTKTFFLRYSYKAKMKGIKVKIIFNENARNYVEEIEKEMKIKFNKRFLFKTTPVEIAFTKDVIAIIILKQEPIAILIKDKDTVNSFITYFNELWKLGKKK